MLHGREKPKATRFGLWPQARRDLRMLWKDLRGESPPPFRVRTGRGGSGAAAKIATRTLRVARIDRETADAVTVYLEDPTGAPVTYRAGQFFTLLVPLGDEILRRAYSACRPAGQGPLPHALAITAKRVPDGRVSTFLNGGLRAGQTLAVLGPSGSFVAPAGARRLVLVGGGSGITPLAAIAQAALADAGAGAPHVTLVHGNRRREDVIFHDALAALATAHPDRFVLRHVLGVPLDEATCARELPADAPGTEYFLCGPAPMMAAARAVLVARGVPATRIHEERFASPPSPTAARAVQLQPQPVLVLTRAGRRSVHAAAGQTLLDAGLAAGIDLPYSCTMGGCGACQVTLVDGTVTGDEDGCLTADERARGRVLACQARPTSPCTLEVP